MEQIVRIHIEKLPEGVYLGTTEDVQGLVAQGRTVAEHSRSHVMLPVGSLKHKTRESLKPLCLP